MTRIKVNAVLAGIGIAILGASATPAIAHAEDTPAGELTTETAEPPVEEPATMWDKTRDVSEDAWDATKQGSARAWDKTKEVSSDAWDATKEGSARAWDKTKGMVQGEPETGEHQEAPAAPGESP